MSVPGRHKLKLNLVSKDVTSADEQRDLEPMRGSQQWAHYSPWLRQRWPEAKAPKSKSFQPSPTPAQSMGAGDSQTYASGVTPGRVGGRSMNDLHQESARKPVADSIAQRIRDTSTQRFDPRFLEIECEQNELEEIVAMIKGDEQSPPIFQEVCNAMEKGEDNGTKAFVDVANKLGAKLVGDEYRDLFMFGNNEALGRNPAIRIDTTHGRDDWDDAGFHCKPDILILREGIEKTEAQEMAPVPTDWKPLIAVGESKRNNYCDMRIGDNNEHFNAGTRILKYINNLARNHPITGRVCGLTLCGRFLRLWFSDSLTFATTRVCDLGNPAHAEDIAKILAFLTGDVKNISDTYTPPTDKFKLVNPDDETEQVWEWCTADGKTDFAGLPYKMLEVRYELWGRRTAVFAGSARKVDDSTGTIEFVTLKCAWLPTYLKNYEHKILTHIHKALNEPVDSKAYPYLEEAKATVDRRVIDCIPRPLGILADCERKSRRVKASFGVSDGLYSDAEQEGVYLELSVLVTSGPHGERVPTEPSSLSLRDHYDILSGVIQTLWVVSCCDVHYRDLNLGNILFHIVKIAENGQAESSEVIGYLIDYGNARILDHRRKQLPDLGKGRREGTTALFLDDARSINAYFVCLHILEAMQLSKNFQEQERMHDNKYSAVDPDSDVPDMMDGILESDPADGAAESEQKLQALLAKLASMKHRYIDDLESLLYCFCFWIAKVVGAKYGDGSKVFKLYDRQIKMTQWEDHLQDLCRDILIALKGWNGPVKQVAEITSKARKQIDVSTVAAQLSEEENKCFGDCYKFMQRVRSNIPKDPLAKGKLPDEEKIPEPTSPTRKGKSSTSATDLLASLLRSTDLGANPTSE